MRKRILLIDNDKELTKINEKVICSAGLASELHIASNGKEALAYLNSRINKNYPLPELIILELILPVMDGFQFLHEFEKLTFAGKSTITIVIFTSSSNPCHKQKASSMGITHYLNKPYLLRNLKAIIEHLQIGKAGLLF